MNVSPPCNVSITNLIHVNLICWTFIFLEKKLLGSDCKFSDFDKHILIKGKWWIGIKTNQNVFSFYRILFWTNLGFQYQ